MKRLRIVVLVREGLVPPETMEGFSRKQIAEWKTEFDVIATLEELGHEVRPIGVFDDLSPLREAIVDWSPQIVFMLLEEFHGIGTYDQAIVGYLELMRQHYTGCNPRGLLLTHDKPLSKKILNYHRVPTPRFAFFPRGKAVRRPKRLALPLFVKSAIEDASLGISQASIVRDDKSLAERVRFIHDKVGSDAIAEEYVEGRELYVGVIGNQRLQTLPPWELLFTKMADDMPRIATARAKWDESYQAKHGIETRAAKGLSRESEEALARLSTRSYRALDMSGYARMDLRLTDDGRIYLIEANANPNLEYGEDFAESAEAAGISYQALLQKIINLGFNYRAPWKE
jgi:D-alanine-D-alanine ligase